MRLVRCVIEFVVTTAPPAPEGLVRPVGKHRVDSVAMGGFARGGGAHGLAIAMVFALEMMSSTSAGVSCPSSVPLKSISTARSP